jgi:hypothetical protein
MRFMLIVIPKGYDTAKPGAMPDTKLVAQMSKFNESMVKAGVMLSGEGLHPLSMGARVSFSGGKPKVIDGPYTEAKEVIGGFWMIQAKSKAEALEWAKRCPMPDGDVVEVRQVQEFEDFPADVQKAAANEPALREQLEKKSKRR